MLVMQEVKQLVCNPPSTHPPIEEASESDAQQRCHCWKFMFMLIISFIIMMMSQGEVAKVMKQLVLYDRDEVS